MNFPSQLDCVYEVSDVYALWYWVGDYKSWITFRVVML